mmetsp:Transcript_95251/g.242028  ORF Transcript_95251/g.242028 Transcript_95251/m.242028 type:complete len:245 (-) Transcript_95251:182-916(-)
MTAFKSSATLTKTSLEGLVCGSWASSTARWCQPHKFKALPTMPWSLSRSLKVPRRRLSIVRSWSKTSRQTNSSLTKVSSTAFTQSSRLSAKTPRTATWMPLGKAASDVVAAEPAGLLFHLWYANASACTAPLLRHAFCNHGSMGRSGSNCTHFKTKASWGASSADESTLLTKFARRSWTKASACAWFRSCGPRHGSNKDSNDRNQFRSFGGFGTELPALAAVMAASAPEAATSAMSWMLTATTA